MPTHLNPKLTAATGANRLRLDLPDVSGNAIIVVTSDDDLLLYPEATIAFSQDNDELLLKCNGDVVGAFGCGKWKFAYKAHRDSELLLNSI